MPGQRPPWAQAALPQAGGAEWLGKGLGWCGSGCPLAVDAGQCDGAGKDGAGLQGHFAPPMPGRHLHLVLFQMSEAQRLFG